jgi:hypothetical protein
MSTAVNDLGMSVDEFRKSVSSLDEVASETNLTIDSIAKNMQAFQQSAVASGGISAAEQAGTVANALAGAFGATEEGKRLIESGRLPGAAEQALPFLSRVFGGITDPGQIFTEENRARQLEYWDKAVDYLNRLKESSPYAGRANDEFVSAMMVTQSEFLNQIFPGLDVADIVTFMNTFGGGRGATVALSEARRQAEDAEERGRRRGGVLGFVSDLYKTGAEAVSVIPGVGHIPLVATLREQGAFPDSEAGREAYVKELSDELEKMGVDETERRSIISRLEERTSRERDFRSETEKIAERIEQGEIPIRVDVQVGVTPEAKGVLEVPEAVTRWNSYTRGGSGPQGSRRLK